MAATAQLVRRTFKPLQQAQPILQEHCFRVVSYNILADKYATSGWHKYVPDQFLAWPYRLELIQRELQQYDADLLCLQEVQKDAYEAQLGPWLEAQGFGSIYVARQSMEVPGALEGSALFYRRSKLEPVATETVMYNTLLTPETGIHPGPSMLQRRQEGLLLALLRHQPTGRMLVAGCTHLFWNPQFPDVKALQAHLMCAAVRGFMRRNELPDDSPVVIGGDFNSLWRKYTSDAYDKIPEGTPYITSGVYELLSTGALPVIHPHHPAVRHARSTSLSPPTSPTATVSASSPPRTSPPTTSPPSSSHPPTSTQPSPGGYLPDPPSTPTRPQPRTSPRTSPTASSPTPTNTASPTRRPREPYQLHSSGLQLQSAHLAAAGNEPPLTTRTANFAGCLDYVWLTPASLQVVDVLEMPFDASQGPDPCAVALDPMPNEHCPSDHLAVGFTLQLKT